MLPFIEKRKRKIPQGKAFFERLRKEKYRKYLLECLAVSHICRNFAASIRYYYGKDKTNADTV